MAITTISPASVATDFLDLLTAGEIDAAAALLHRDVAYTNVSLPTIRGRDRVRRALRATLGRSAVGFEVHTHVVGTEGDTVLTERTDVLTIGPWRAQFWVYGRFEIDEDGLICVWRDSFDWLNVTAGTLRGLAGVALPGLRARPPLTRRRGPRR